MICYAHAPFDELNDTISLFRGHLIGIRYLLKVPFPILM